MRRKMLCLLLTLCLVLGTAPMMPAFAEIDGSSDFVSEEVSEWMAAEPEPDTDGEAMELAAGSYPVMQAGTKGIQDPEGSFWDRIWFGSKYESSVMKWRVLDTKANTGGDGIFMMAESLYGPTRFNPEGTTATGWQGSAAQAWCRNFLNNTFSLKEQATIQETTKTDTTGYGETVTNNLNKDKVFFPSLDEIKNEAYGLSSDSSRAASEGAGIGAQDYWLRTSHGTWSLAYVQGGVWAGQIEDNISQASGVFDWELLGRPAVNLDKSHIVFTTPTDNSMHQDFGLVPTYSSRSYKPEWKLTLTDEYDFTTGKLTGTSGPKTVSVTSHDVEGVSAMMFPGEEITIKHTPLADITEHYNRLTAAVVEKSSGNLVAYGAINTDMNAGTTTFYLPKDLPAGNYTMSIYGEIWKHVAGISDYASAVPYTFDFFVEPGIVINEYTFPDPNFRAYVSENIDGNTGMARDGKLWQQELEAVTEINVDSKSISDLTGIAYFYNLENLKCWNNTITTLDVSKNTKLKTLKCGYNGMESLNVSGCTELESLECWTNNLTELDLSKNKKLTYLDCNSNQLKALNLSKNTLLTYLSCEENQLAALDLSNNLLLETLYCYENHLSALSLEDLIRLSTLSCGSQTVNITVTYDYTYDMNFLGDFARMSEIKGEGFNVLTNTTTGIIQLVGSPANPVVTYNYDTQSVTGAAAMDVTLVCARGAQGQEFLIPSVYLTVDAPVRGAAIPTSHAVSPGVSEVELSWNPHHGHTFQGGTAYTCEVDLIAHDGYFFTADTEVYFNGRLQNITVLPSGEATLSYTFPKTPDATVSLVTNPADGSMGTATISDISGPYGTEIVLSATPAVDHHFVGWEVVPEGAVTIENPRAAETAFTLLGEDAEITAVFGENVPVTVTLDRTNGSWYLEESCEKNSLETVSGVAGQDSTVYFWLKGNHKYETLPVIDGAHTVTLVEGNGKDYCYKVVFTAEDGKTLTPPTPVKGEAHTHPICGPLCDHEGEFTEAVEWIPVRDSIPEEPGYYYLEEDIDLEYVYYPKNGVYLCLNGHRLGREKNKAGVIDVTRWDTTFTLTDCSTKVSWGNLDSWGDWVDAPEGEGTMQIVGGWVGLSWTGSISFGSNDYGAVFLGYPNTFNMHGGNLVNNISNDGAAGVDVGNWGNGNNGATFNMYSGTIFFNDCHGSGTPAVRIVKGTFNMYGGEIRDNYTGWGKTNVSGVELINSENASFNYYGGTIADNEYGDLLLYPGNPMTVHGTLTNTTPMKVKMGTIPQNSGEILIKGTEQADKFEMLDEGWTLEAREGNLVAVYTATAEVLTAVNTEIDAPKMPRVAFDTSAVTDENFTCTAVSWTPEHARTERGAVYTVTLNLQARVDKKFDETTVFQVNGQPATVKAMTASTATITYTFPATEDPNIVVSPSALDFGVVQANPEYGYYLDAWGNAMNLDKTATFTNVGMDLSSCQFFIDTGPYGASGGSSQVSNGFASGQKVEIDFYERRGYTPGEYSGPFYIEYASYATWENALAACDLRMTIVPAGIAAATLDVSGLTGAVTNLRKAAGSLLDGVTVGEILTLTIEPLDGVVFGAVPAVTAQGGTVASPTGLNAEGNYVYEIIVTDSSALGKQGVAIKAVGSPVEMASLVEFRDKDTLLVNPTQDMRIIVGAYTPSGYMADVVLFNFPAISGKIHTMTLDWAVSLQPGWILKAYILDPANYGPLEQPAAYTVPAN